VYISIKIQRFHCLLISLSDFILILRDIWPHISWSLAWREGPKQRETSLCEDSERYILCLILIWYLPWFKYSKMNLLKLLSQHDPKKQKQKKNVWGIVCGNAPLLFIKVHNTGMILRYLKMFVLWSWQQFLWKMQMPWETLAFSVTLVTPSFALVPCLPSTGLVPTTRQCHYTSLCCAKLFSFPSRPLPKGQETIYFPHTLKASVKSCAPR